MVLNLTIIEIKLSETKILFFLIQKAFSNGGNTLIYPVCASIVELNNNVIFIESLDTTGLFQPRNKQTFYTKAFISAIIDKIFTKYNISRIECFSHPKSELLFVTSHRKKRILSPAKLLDYWRDIFVMICNEVILWSNYDKKVFLHGSITDIDPIERLAKQKIVFFDDDPKRKLKISLNDVKNIKQHKIIGRCKERTDTNSICGVNFKNFYRILLTRKDFVSGGLIIGIGLKKIKNYTYVNEKIIRNIMCTYLETNQIFLDEKNSYSIDMNTFLDTLRKLNWSTCEQSYKSLKEILGNDMINNLQFTSLEEIEDHEIQKKELETIISIKTRKKQ